MYWEWFHNMFPRPARRYIVVAALLMGLLIFGVLATQVLKAINSIGWSDMTSSRSGLPNDSVNEILALPDGRMMIGTEGGAAIWKGASGADVEDDWQIFTPANSLLPDQHVLSVTQDKNGVLWFGTDAGLASYDGQNWEVYHSSDFGLTSDQINAVSVDENNNIWIGTQEGLARFDGMTWTAFTEENSDLIDNAVFTIANQTTPITDKVWFGTLSGVSVYDLETDEWESFSRKDIDLGVGGVSDLDIDSTGRLWVSTEGGGISIWDGDQWTHLRVSNSSLPYSTIESVAELEPGVFWIAASLPNTAGGVLAKFDGSSWKIYKEGLTGYPGADTVTIAKDNQGRYWFGTRTNGIILYEPKD
jgi:ligand-binding sensor domain-containing protein